MNNIKSALKEVENDINESANKVGRSVDSVKLIAVSKTKPIEALKEAYDYGMRDFGENKVQEMCDKMEAMPDDIRWHMIGHLQRNKVKYIIGKTYLIHSVDSLRLAEEISKESLKKNVTTNILIEVNVAGEESKFGTNDNVANLELLSEISKLPNINIMGLMTIAPYTENAEDNRIYFKQLYDFAHKDAAQYINGEPVLSMGMSGDYKVAVEEGATYVRVGSKIFGERNYQI